MRKYLFSGAIIGATFGLVRLLLATKKRPKDARLALDWAGWGLSTAIAVGSLREKSREIGEKQRG